MTIFDSGRSGWNRRRAEQDILLAQKGIEQLDDGLELEVRSASEKLRIGYFEMKKRNRTPLWLRSKIETPRFHMKMSLL